MEQAQQVLFGPFRLDPSTERLWHGEQEVALRAKPWAVLRYLVEHPGRVVTKEELLKTVWAGTYVTKTVLKVCVREIREALDEEVAAPRYIETVATWGISFWGKGVPRRPTRRRQRHALMRGASWAGPARARSCSAGSRKPGEARAASSS